MTLALTFSGDRAGALITKGKALGDAAWALVGLHETEPDLAATAGVEVAALEARGILEGGAVERVEASLNAGRQASVVDVEAISRLEGILSVSEARIGACMGAIDAQQAPVSVEKVAGFIGLATGAVSLIRSIF